MAWIRLSDDYNDHPKIDHLSDGAFRLWHQGMGFCRKFKTDGMIPTQTVRGFKAHSPKRLRELLTPWQAGENPLWHAIDGFGVKVHDYLEWNPSKEEENERRADSKERMRVMREQRHVKGVAPSPGLQSVSTNSVQTTRNVLGQGREQERQEEKSGADDLGDRARWLMESYPEWYRQERKGARHPLIGGPLQFQDACVLVSTWENARLEKLARIVLTTDDEPFIVKSDRGFKIFTLKATWADDRLTAWEAERKPA